MSNFERIILVDDDKIVILISSYIIEKYMPGVAIMSFTSAEEAVHFIKDEYKHSPVETLMLLDINMPILTGWEVLDELEEIKEEMKEWIKVFMFSSSVIADDHHLSNTHPLVSGFIEKPLTLEKLTTISNNSVERVYSKLF